MVHVLHDARIHSTSFENYFMQNIKHAKISIHDFTFMIILTDRLKYMVRLNQ